VGDSYTFLPVACDHELTVSFRLASGVVMTAAPSPATVQRGEMAALEYVVDQGAGIESARADVTIRIVDSDAKTVKTMRCRGVTLNEAHNARFVCSLPEGEYTFLVTAKASDGRDSTNVASNQLTVR
jgi:hypothetical protein